MKYEGYIERQKRQVEQYKKLENKKIPDDIDYDDVYSLRKEAVQKLKELRPASVGQASRISGVSPADISVLLIYLEKVENISHMCGEVLLYVRYILYSFCVKIQILFWEIRLVRLETFFIFLIRINR